MSPEESLKIEGMFAEFEKKHREQMAAIEKKHGDQLQSLDDRLKTQDTNWARLYWAVGLLGTALVMMTGYGFIQIPRAAKDKAVEYATPIAKHAAEDEVKIRIPQTMIDEIEKRKERADTAANLAEKSQKKVKEIENQLLDNPVAHLKKELLDAIDNKQIKVGSKAVAIAPSSETENARNWFIAVNGRSWANDNSKVSITSFQEDDMDHRETPISMSKGEVIGAWFVASAGGSTFNDS